MLAICRGGYKGGFIVLDDGEVHRLAKTNNLLFLIARCAAPIAFGVSLSKRARRRRARFQPHGSKSHKGKGQNLMSSVYFGGSRHLGTSPLIAQIIGAVMAQGSRVHVGCQFGADLLVAASVCATSPSRLSLFAVASSLQAAPAHVGIASQFGASVTLSAGGTSAPIHARYLLRSIAAFQGCSQAVFFSPGAGSLAVARECVRAGLPVYAFNPTPARVPVMPAPIPSVSGSWVRSLFMGRFLCWRWQATQLALF